MQTSGEASAPITPGLRGFLYAVAAVNGAAIMIIEILGAKLLAPYMGTSHFVWTAQIGVAMGSLATGYYFGGRWADAAGHLNRLFTGMIVAALYLVGVLLVVRPVAERFIEFPLAVGSLLASIFLFFVPLALLAMTGPFLVRFITAHIQSVGGSVGRLSAVSTVGSLGGVALIGYVLLPLLPNSVTMVGTAGLIAGLAVFYFVVWGRRPIPAAVGFLAVVGIGALGIQSHQKVPFKQVTQLHRSNSDFGELQVLELKGSRIRFFLNDYLIQNTYDADSKQSLSLFTFALRDLAVKHTTHLDRVLCIGLGVGIVPAEFAAMGVQVDAVEINPEIVPMAKRYFDLDPDRFRLVIGDGRQFLNRNTNRYDAVILDAFLGDSSPSHLMTVEAFSAMRAVMSPEGVLVVNSFGDRRPGWNFFVTSLHRTLLAVFPHVQLHDPGTGNLFFLASPSPLTEHRTVTVAAVPQRLRGEWQRLQTGSSEVDPGPGRVLTDDFNPVDFFDSANREKLRRELARGMRSL